MNCAVCGEEAETHFLGKIVGTYVDGEPVCADCQRAKAMDELKRAVE
jgi:hypothetical protein